MILILGYIVQCFEVRYLYKIIFKTFLENYDNS